MTDQLIPLQTSRLLSDLHSESGDSKIQVCREMGGPTVVTDHPRLSKVLQSSFHSISGSVSDREMINNNVHELQVIEKGRTSFGDNVVLIVGPHPLWWLLSLRPGDWRAIYWPPAFHTKYGSWFSA